MFQLEKLVRGFRPLLYHYEQVILSRGRELFTATSDLSNIQWLCSLPTTAAQSLIPRVRLVERILRSSCHAACTLDENHILVSRRDEIWKIDTRSGRCELDLLIPYKRKALQLSQVELNADKCIGFGEYFDNVERGEVRVWIRRCEPSAQWKIAGQFGPNEIYHVHNLVWLDAKRKVLVLTGDFEHEAAIWEASNCLNSFAPILRGSQRHRACWMWASLSGTVFYATDSQLEENHVIGLDLNSAHPTPRVLSSIEGSSIYAGFGIDYAVFSTSVEPSAPSGRFIADLVSRQRGPGIRSNEAKIVSLASDGTTLEFFSAKKDAWPFRLAQFGTFMFPNGVMPAESFIAYGNAIENYDDRCLLFRRE